MSRLDDLRALVAEWDEDVRPYWTNRERDAVNALPALLDCADVLIHVLRLGHIEDDGPSRCPCTTHERARAALARLEEAR